MKPNVATRTASGIRHHPWRAALICVAVVAGCVYTSTTVASARPQPMLAVPASALNAAPAAHVLNFAADSGGKKVQVKAGAVQVKEPWNVDGCDHDYGTPNQCVPWTIPVPVSKACAWLESMGFGPLQVVGTNRQHLPENAQGIACATNA